MKSVHQLRILLFVTLLLGVFALSACQPTYSKHEIELNIAQEIQKDWGISTDEVRLEAGHLGIVFKTAHLFAEDGGLTQEAKDEIANTGRTIERVLASSDANVDRLSVMAASADSTLNVYFERDYAEIRKKRVGAVAWQNIINTDVYDTVPTWRWEAFDRDYDYYTEQDPLTLALLLQEKIRAHAALDVTVRISGNTLGILTRVAKMLDGKTLTPEADARINALLTEAGLFAMKSAYPLAKVTVTMMGSDADVNVFRTDVASNFRARVLEEIDQATHLSRIEQGKTPFWEWKEFGIITLYTDEDALTLIQQEGGGRLDRHPGITMESDKLTVIIDLATPALPPMGSYLQSDSMMRFLARVERILILSTTKPAMVQIAFRDTSGHVGCLKRNLQDTISLVEGAITTIEYMDLIAIASGDICLPTPIMEEPKP